MCMLCMCLYLLVCIYVCMSVLRVYRAYEDKKSVSDLLDLELYVLVSCQTENQNQVLW